ncbi:hypothetical protein PIB30_062761 [Stylosanthes scabra]|uniref:Uncharacterized protein n=1 Tax=Stylosanthes scabra TaxID=79078 RepID=A0ABU6UP77_9FABA|nr:hypothetical protein [Stylosanthes scabra]
MRHTRSTSLAKGKTRVPPRLAALRCKDPVQPQTQTPDIPAKEIVTSILPPKKHLNYRMTEEGYFRKDTKTLCRRSRRIAALYSVTKPVSEEKVVIEISDDSVQQEDINLEQGGALPSAEGGGGVDLPKNDVYDALWVMLDSESENEAEEIPGQWDLDSDCAIFKCGEEGIVVADGMKIKRGHLFPTL